MEKRLAKPFVAVLTSRLEWQDKIIETLEQDFGQADFVGKWHPFTHTKYYEKEMGGNLSRCLVSFEKNMVMHDLVRAKLTAKKLEDKFKEGGKRLVNFDPGYVDLYKVVLASCKGGGHMLMLSDDVYVDFLLWYNKGWRPMPWAYPDFAGGIYFPELEKIRKMFKKGF